MMPNIVRIAVAALLLATPPLEEAWAQMGPMNTLPFGAKSRTKPNPSDQQTVDQDNDTVKPPPVKPVEATPEPTKPKTADK